MRLKGGIPIISSYNNRYYGFQDESISREIHRASTCKGTITKGIKNPVQWFCRMGGAKDANTHTTPNNFLLMCAAYPVLRKPGTQQFAKSTPETYMEQIKNIQEFIENCGVLTCIEHQLKAYERQQYHVRSSYGEEKENHTFSENYWRNDLPDSFFEQLYSLQSKFWPTKVKKDEWIDSCKEFWTLCKKQPIASMMLPILFTTFITDYPKPRNVYCQMKYKFRKLSHVKEKRIIYLWISVRTLLEETMSGEEGSLFTDNPDGRSAKFADIYKNPPAQFSPFVPVFNWKKIISAFCRRHELKGADRNEVQAAFMEYRYKNGLGANEKKNLSKQVTNSGFHYGDPLQKLAKLCNYNVFLMLRSGVQPTGTIKTALEDLKQGKLIPRTKIHISKTGCESWDIYQKYFAPYYREECGLPDLALLRYYRLPLQGDFDSQPAPLANLQDLIQTTTSDCIQDIYTNYRDTQFIQNLRNTDFAPSLKLNKCENSLNAKITRCFSDEDFKSLISQENNFTVEGFPLYLQEFCNRHDITIYEQLEEREQPYVESEALFSMLKIAQHYIINRVMQSWQDEIGKLVYAQ